MGRVIGIDLGTTNSCMAVLDGGEPSVVENAEGGRTTPSVVAFTKDGQRLVGAPARRQQVTNPQNTISSIKRFMGRKWEEVSDEMTMIPYEVVKGDGGDARVIVDGKEYAPPEISAMTLQKLKQDAEAYLGETVTDAVITVPAYFNNAQREATKDAGKVAGLNVLRIINEPTAASLAYGLDKEQDQTILVFDLGGGTFDVSILEVENELIEVLSTNGDTHLGGDDFDEAVIDYIAGEFKREHSIDLRKDPMALQRLREASEKAKKELSTQQTTDINLPFITADASGAKHLQLSISRAKFEELIDPLVERCRQPVLNALKDARLKPSDIHEVVLVGGSTRVPRVQRLVRDMFGKDPHQGVNPDEVVSLGAAIQGGIIAGDVKDVVLLDVTPLSLGIETEGGIMTTLVERNTTIPTTKTETFSTAADNQPAVTIRVFQGERRMAGDNRLLDEFTLDGITPAPRGVPQIEVKFDIDVNGILSVSARDKATSKQQTVQIKQSSGLSQDEIERMRKDAEAHADDDKRKQELASAKNEASSLIYQTEKTLKEHGSKLDGGSKSAIEASIAKVRSASEGTDAAAIRSAVSELTQAAHALAQHMYADKGGAQGGPDAAGGQSGPAGGDDVIDAEFEKK